MSDRKIFAALIIVFSLLSHYNAHSQVSFKKTYWGNTVETVFSSAMLTTPSKSDDIATLRVSNIFNVGVTLNHDFSNVTGVYAGAGIKNIGFIEKYKSPDSTVKRRVYCIDLSAGFKIGNLYKRNYILLGGGGDFAFNYKEKGFIKRGHKTKFNEWFSDRTPAVMPYVFAGASFSPGLVIKLIYYPQNFFNTGYTEKISGVQPYAGYDVNMFMVSIGADIHHHKPPKIED